MEPPSNSARFTNINNNAYKNTNRTSVTDNATTTATYCYDNADRLYSTTDSRYGSLAYDGHGNTTTLGTQTMTYDKADRHMSTADGSTNVVYTRDALDRVISRTNGTTVTRYSFGDNSDSPSAVLDSSNNLIDKEIGLLGGLTQDVRGSTTTWHYPNIHGDVVASADSVGAKQGSTNNYDPFGNALNAIPDNATGNFDYGWLGQHERGTEHEGSLQTIEMGARQYVPGLGRFLEVDPIEGGSANDYDYASGDPLNYVDLHGSKKKKRSTDWLADYSTVDPWGKRFYPRLLRGNAYWGWNHIEARGHVREIGMNDDQFRYAIRHTLEYRQWYDPRPWQQPNGRYHYSSTVKIYEWGPNRTIIFSFHVIVNKDGTIQTAYGSFIGMLTGNQARY